MDFHSNPFSTCFVRPGAIEYLYSVGIDSEPQTKRLAETIMRTPASLIVGPHGSGKTTLLHSLQPYLTASQIETVLLHSPTQTGFRAALQNRRQNFANIAQRQQHLPPRGLLIVDGLEQLGRRSRRKLLRLAEAGQYRILATSHHELTGFTTVFQTPGDPNIIQSIISHLTTSTSSDVKELIASELKERNLSTVVDIRELLFELYDLVATYQPGRSPAMIAATQIENQ